jgi:hypothetical protein
VFAWGLGQAPCVLPGRLTIEQAAGSSETELTLLVIAAIPVVLVIPSLMLLYMLDQRSKLQSPVGCRPLGDPLCRRRWGSPSGFGCLGPASGSQDAQLPPEHISTSGTWLSSRARVPTIA